VISYSDPLCFDRPATAQTASRRGDTVHYARVEDQK